VVTEDYPKYSDVGRILVRIFGFYGHGHSRVYRYDSEVLYLDGCAAIIEEGTGIAYWLDGHVDLEQPGVYVIEGITGRFIKGDWGFTDDDEEWEFTHCRYATDEEIRTEALS
jgi:hypothetical protein